MAKVELQLRKETAIETGDIFLRGDKSEVCLLVCVDYVNKEPQYCLVDLEGGNRLRNPMSLEAIKRYIANEGFTKIENAKLIVRQGV